MAASDELNFYSPKQLLDGCPNATGNHRSLEFITGQLAHKNRKTNSLAAVREIDGDHSEIGNELAMSARENRKSRRTMGGTNNGTSSLVGTANEMQ